MSLCRNPTYQVSLHLLNLNFHSIEGLAQEFALLCRWEGHGGGGGRQGFNSLVKGRKYCCQRRDSGGGVRILFGQAWIYY